MKSWITKLERLPSLTFRCTICDTQFKPKNYHQIYCSSKCARKGCFDNLRHKVIDKLGGKCSNPNCPIPPDKMNYHALQIDHVDGGGCQEYKNIGTNAVMRKILENSQGYQILCVYCNWIKRYEENEK